jgi:hypothetical protein
LVYQNFFHGSEKIATDTATKSAVTKDADTSSITHSLVSKANSSFSNISENFCPDSLHN